ncbi:hypothetical protein ACP70R_031128 [Stipagrostis hirtigluma subsp. patula]
MVVAKANHPRDDTLINHYLHAKIAGEMHGHASDCFAHDVDVCSVPPYKLAEEHSSVAGAGSADGRVWFFFSPARYVGASKKMRLRTVGGTGGKEHWHAEGKGKPVKGTADGYITKLSYHVKIAPGVDAEKPGWLMVEYGVTGADTVLCKIYKSPRGTGRSRASSSSSSPASCGRKRKAADSSEHHMAAPPSARARLQTGQDDDHGVQISGDHADSLQFGETQHMAAVGQPEPELTPEVIGDNGEQMARLEESGTFLSINDDHDDGMAFHVPDGVGFEEFYESFLMEGGKKQGAVVLPCAEPGMVQTVHDLDTDYDVIMALAAGQTVGELLDGPSTSVVCCGG